jgi:hypothetical protein
MNRRHFFRTALVAAASALTPSPVQATPRLRAVHRWHNGAWVRCRMRELRGGDLFWLEGAGAFVADCDPAAKAGGGCSVYSESIPPSDPRHPVFPPA